MRRKSNKKLVILITVLILLYRFVPGTGSSQLQSEEDYIDVTNLKFTQTWNPQQANIEKPSPPNVWNVLNNVSSFTAPNDTVYLGDDVIPDALMEGIQWSYLQINLTALYVWDDHSAIGPGDIYVRWIPNYWIGPPEYDLNNNWQNYQYVDDLTIDHDLYLETPIYQIDDNLNDWYNFSSPITLFEGWTVLNCMLLEVFDMDVPTADDSLGGFYWVYKDPNEQEGYMEISATDVDIALKITVLDTNTTFSAKNLTELFQPFLIDNDDTSHTADPDGLFARVIHGYDPSIDRNSLCIQYLYYWQEVWLDGFWSDQLIHYYDYELIQIYLNFSYTGGPLAYRFVFDNHDEYTNSSTEWRDSMEYAIYEWDVDETGLQSITVQNSIELQPLLGENHIANYEYKNLTGYTDSFCGCYGGVPSLMLTIETYNHQFAIGNTGGDILGQYSINPFNDTIIYNCYSLVNLSFTQGVHDVEGFMVPNYAPFAYDVLKVFESPYIHSNYDEIMQEAAAFQGSIYAKGGFLKIERDIELTLEIPLQTNINLPNTLQPGASLISVLETVLDTSRAALTIEYYFNISADFSIFFVDYYFESIFQNKIVINFSNPIIQFLCDFTKLNDNQLFSLNLLSNMLSIEASVTPQLLGEILDCNITLHIDEILKSVFPSLSWIIDIFFEDIYLKINPVISGYLNGNLNLGDSNSALSWNSLSRDYDVSLTVPDLSYGNSLSLELTDLEYNINLQVDWLIGYETGNVISWLFGDGKEYWLAKWPNLDFNLASLEDKVVINTWEAGASEWTTEANTENNPPIITGYPIIFTGIIMFSIILPLIKIKTKKLKK